MLALYIPGEVIIGLFSGLVSAVGWLAYRLSRANQHVARLEEWVRVREELARERRNQGSV